MIEQPFADLESWVAYFREASLPVLRHTVQELERMREDADNVSGRTLSATILRDPLLTLRVIFLIHWHALRLGLKRIPWHRKAARADLQQGVLNPHDSITPSKP